MNCKISYCLILDIRLKQTFISGIPTNKIGILRYHNQLKESYIQLNPNFTKQTFLHAFHFNTNFSVKTTR